MLRLRRFALSLVVFSSSPLSAMNLDEVFEKALSQSEIVRGSQLDVQLAESVRSQANTRMRPSLNLRGRTMYRMTKPDRSDWDSSYDPGVQTELRQPLYDGGLTEAYLQNSESLIRAAQFSVETARQDLYLEVLFLFYEVLRSEQDLRTLKETRELLEDRVGVLNQREKIGRSRLAELLAARTQLTLTESQIVAAQTANRNAQEQLAWLCGLQAPLKLEDTLTLEMVRRERERKVDAVFYPTIEAAKARVEAAEAQIRLNKAELTPQLDFVATHDWAYLDPTDQGQHVFAVGLGLTWTLYDAGLNRALVTSATIARNQAQLIADREARETQLNVSLANQTLDEGLTQYDALRRALEVSERNVRNQRQEYETGLITNLEVLEALDQRLEIRRDIDSTLYRIKIAYLERRVRLGHKLTTSLKGTPQPPANDPTPNTTTDPAATSTPTKP